MLLSPAAVVRFNEVSQEKEHMVWDQVEKVLIAKIFTVYCLIPNITLKLHCMVWMYLSEIQVLKYSDKYGGIKKLGR
jgi:hypothetical protein